MPMQLRSTTRMVPPPSSSDPAAGSVEMDAPVGTSTDNGENDGESSSPVSTLTPSVPDMGHSADIPSSTQDAVKPHSSDQDAAEAGHRSSGRDHSRSNADAASAGSHGITHQEGGAMSDDLAGMGPTLIAVQDGDATSEAAFHDAQDDAGLASQGFSFPKKSSRASSVRTSSPVMDTSAKFFGDWFESTDADGPGEVPADWIKQESVSVDLDWTPAVNDIEFSFESLMREISENLTSEEKAKMLKRNAKLRRAHLKPAKSISETTTDNGSPASHVSIHPEHMSSHAIDASQRSQASRTANSTPRIPAAAKGKGRDFTTAPSMDYNDDHVSENEAADDEARLYQLEADAILAMELQKQLDTHRPEVPTKPVAGPSNNNAAAAGATQTAMDHEIAANLQKMFDEQYERMRTLNDAKIVHGNSSLNNDGLQGRREEAGRRNKAPNERPSPMDQVPKTSILFRKVTGNDKSTKAKHKHASPPSSDDSSSSSSDSDSDDSVPSYLHKSRKSKKKSKKSKKNKKGKKTRRSKRKATPPSSDDSSSESDPSSSSSSDSESDWSSLGSGPSEANSDDSKKTKRQKKRAKKAWNMKLLRLRLEQSNAKPDPPFVYNGEANFNTIERWTYEAREWTKESYIRPNMKVSRVSKYLGGRALNWYMRVVAKGAKKWRLKKFFEALFNHCFPVDFRSIQRKKFQSFAQRGHSIKEYRTDLEVLADSVGDITTRGLVVQFWDGADYEMRRRWAGDGFDPETSTLKELEAAAINYEHALKVEKSQKPDRANGRKDDQTDASRSGKRQDANTRTPRQEGGNKNGGSSKDADKGNRRDYGNKGDKDHADKPKNGGNKSHNLTKDQLNEYRAQGKCFTCADTGHLSKDCPKNNQIKPPKNRVGAAAISFAEIERRRNLKEAQKLGVFALSVEHIEITQEHRTAIDEVLVAKMHFDLSQAVPFVWDYFGDPEDDPYAEDRFTIIPTQLGWLVCDKHLNDHHEVFRTQLGVLNS
ncbi:hypothetical protein DFH06DRAFT_1315850 [Mycena polygramma]|nr:hypothetical protein DFH06DRAFT_1315850 [Mycena polygramma]